MGCIRRAVCSFRGSPGLTAAPDGGCCTNPAAGLPLCGRRVLSASKDVKLVVATDLTRLLARNAFVEQAPSRAAAGRGRMRKPRVSSKLSATAGWI